MRAILVKNKNANHPAYSEQISPWHSEFITEID